MPGPLTETEKAQIVDHLGWSNIEHDTDYVSAWLRPTLDTMTNEQKIEIARGHLEHLNTLLQQIKDVTSNFELDEVKGIKFSRAAEGRLWAQYRAFVVKLAASLSVEYNKRVYRSSGGRAIL